MGRIKISEGRTKEQFLEEMSGLYDRMIGLGNRVMGFEYRTGEPITIHCVDLVEGE